MRLLMRTILLSGLVWAAGLGCAGEEPEVSGKAETGQGEVVFPPSEFFQLGNHEGKVVDLRDFKGRIVLLNFGRLGAVRVAMKSQISLRCAASTKPIRLPLLASR